MSDEITPALTPDEWAEGSHTMHEGITIVDDGGATTVELPENRALSFVGAHRHALAALCLYGQPFGFTQEDAALVAFLASCWSDPEWNEDMQAHAKSLAARIAALLPPGAT